jgi:hypothetical protein
MEPFNPIAGKPPRRVVIDRQRKLFASLDIEDLLCELVSATPTFLPAAAFEFRTAV